MVAVPPETPKTTPELFTVAMAVFEDVQGVEAWAVAEPVRIVVLFFRTVVVPDMVGLGLTVPDAATVLLVAPVDDRVMFPLVGLVERAAIRT